MSTTEKVKDLLNTYEFTKAFVLDDAYDTVPEFTQLIDLVSPDLVDVLQTVSKEVAAELNTTLEEFGIESDDWDTAISCEGFLRRLWELKLQHRLPEPVVKAAFGAYQDEVLQKRNALAPLLKFLKDDLKLSVSQAGRESTALPADTKVVFLDLFLGITDNDAAREEAADKIKELLAGLGDYDRPIVVLMSSKRGEELESMSEVLRSRAGLMGAKF